MGFPIPVVECTIGVMGFLLSRCVGLVTPNPVEAANYYQNHFGMRVAGVDPIVELVAGSIRLYLDPGKRRPLVMELLATDLQEARHAARQFGFEEIVWRGQGESCLLRDPFGLIFNVHHERTAFELDELEPPEQSFVKPCLGAILPEARYASEFYASVFECPNSKLPDGSYVVDSGPIRLRFKEGNATLPVVWIRNDSPLEDLIMAGCTRSERGTIVDPLGINWCLDPPVPAERAVCSPI